MLSTFQFLAYCILISTSSASNIVTQVCPLLGSAFPAPSGLNSHKRFQAAVDSFDSALTTTLKTGVSSNGPGLFNATTFSIGIFSTLEEDLIYQRHYTDQVVRYSKTGVHEVDANSIYRLGSISKALTVYLFLIRDGFQHFEDAVTEYIPELAITKPADRSQDGITPKWNQITIRDLASHLAGLTEDCKPDNSCDRTEDADGVNDVSYSWTKPPGFPPIAESQVPTCNHFDADGIFRPCHRQEYLDGLMAEPALWQPGYTATYSNNGIELLGLALENITGTSLNHIFTESIVEALGLNRTSYTVPASTQHGVIPGNATSSGWDSDLGILGAAGGYFSSLNDMAKIGRAILNSTLLSRPETRRWLKPVSLVSDVDKAVGAPWEIFRTQVRGRTVDLYTKNGGLGAYGTLLVLVPDYDFGFTILSATTLGSDIGSSLVYFISEMLGEAVLPSLEDIAREQAKAAFSGRYIADEGNSSMVISIDDQPGLRVAEWINHGVNILEELGSGSPSTDVEFRLQPNQLYAGSQIGFSGVQQILPARKYTGPLNLNCFTWGNTRLTYGNVDIGDFAFNVDQETGKATCVMPKALRNKLQKVEED